METTLSLSRVLELGKKRSLRGGVAREETRLLRQQQDATRLDLIAETARRFVRLVGDQERLTLARNERALLQRTQAVIEHRVKAGKTPVAESRLAAVRLAQSELELEHAEHQVAVSRLKLSILWGEPGQDAVEALADLLNVEDVGGFDGYARLLEDNPDLVRLATSQRLAEARVRMEQAGRWPNIDLSGGVRYLSKTNDAALVLSASIPLGSTRRASPFIDEARLRSLREPLAYEERRRTLHAALFELHQELTHTRMEVKMLRTRMIPESESAQREYEEGYAAGRFSLLELINLQQVVLDLRRKLLMAATNYHLYRIEIDRLTGATMTEIVP